MPDEDRESQSRAVERLTVFSDAVVAIAITLLALDLPVPEGDTASAFWASVQRNDGHYAAFLISFMVIAGAWSNHHDLFRYAIRTDSRLRAINTAWLLTIVLNPFATKMLTVSGHSTLEAHALRFGFYALLQVLESGAMLAMLRHMASHGQIPGAPPPVVANMTRKEYVLMVSFGLSIPVFFVITNAWLLWLALPVLVAQVRRLRRRNPRNSETGQNTPHG